MKEEKLTLPLTSLEMVEFFKNKEKVYLIDYKKTKEVMSPKNMLVYLGNLQITCEFDYIDYDLIAEYIVLKDVVNVLDLNYFFANVLFYNKYQSHFAYFEDFEEIFEKLMKDNKDIIEHYQDVLESSLLFVLSYSDKALITKENTVPGKNEKFGFAFLKLYSIPGFLLAFLEKQTPIENQTYFESYFDNDNFIFNGRNLFSYFAIPENLYFQLIVNVSRVNDLMHGGEMTENGQDAVNRMKELHESIEVLDNSQL